MIELLTVSIGMGLGISLLFGEVFGVTAGGMIVPGYMALYLDRPLDVLLTLAAAFATYAIVHGLSTIVILFGRRRTVMMILVGYLAGAAVRWGLGEQLLPTTDIGLIGFIIPGLIAIWMERQGVIETVMTLATASAVVRLLLIILVGEGLLE